MWAGLACRSGSCVSWRSWQQLGGDLLHAGQPAGHWCESRGASQASVLLLLFMVVLINCFTDEWLFQEQRITLSSNSQGKKANRNFWRNSVTSRIRARTRKTKPFGKFLFLVPLKWSLGFGYFCTERVCSLSSLSICSPACPNYMQISATAENRVWDALYIVILPTNHAISESNSQVSIFIANRNKIALLKPISLNICSVWSHQLENLWREGAARKYHFWQFV